MKFHVLCIVLPLSATFYPEHTISRTRLLRGGYILKQSLVRYPLRTQHHTEVPPFISRRGATFWSPARLCDLCQSVHCSSSSLFPSVCTPIAFGNLVCSLSDWFVCFLLSTLTSASEICVLILHVMLLAPSRDSCDTQGKCGHILI